MRRDCIQMTFYHQHFIHRPLRFEIEPFSFSDEEFFSKNQPNEMGLSKNIKQTGDCRGRQRFKVKCESERLNDRIESEHKSKRNEATYKDKRKNWEQIATFFFLM